MKTKLSSRALRDWLMRSTSLRNGRPELRFTPVDKDGKPIRG